jgi:acyl-CoA thioesterase FadM
VEDGDWLLMVTSLAYRRRVTVKPAVTIVLYVTRINARSWTFAAGITVTAH